jgi:hypothetical protein
MCEAAGMAQAAYLEQLIELNMVATDRKLK